MCGIAGIYNFEKNHPVDMATIQRMCDSIAHRGPDHEGFYQGEHSDNTLHPEHRPPGNQKIRDGLPGQIQHGPRSAE